METASVTAPIKVYADAELQAAITCPFCGFSKQVDVSSYRNSSKRLKATCKCGQTFRFDLEFRGFFRKSVNLPGVYTNLVNGSQGKITVENLSLKGVGFTCNGPMLIREDDSVEISFRLDDAQATRIVKRIQVRTVDEPYVGGEFCEHERHSADLGFYLRQ